MKGRTMVEFLVLIALIVAGWCLFEVIRHDR